MRVRNFQAILKNIPDDCAIRQRSLVFLSKENKLGVYPMTAQAKKSTGAVTKTSNPPYPFRTTVLLILLAGNFLIAGIYFHLLNP